MTNGECIFASLQDAQLEGDDEVAREALRVVDIHLHGECSSNLRCERRRDMDAPKYLESLEVVCLTLEKAQVNKEGVATLGALETKVTRLQLSTRGSVRAHLKASCRKVIRDRLTIIGGLQRRSSPLAACLRFVLGRLQPVATAPHSCPQAAVQRRSSQDRPDPTLQQWRREHERGLAEAVWWSRADLLAPAEGSVYTSAEQLDGGARLDNILGSTASSKLAY